MAKNSAQKIERALLESLQPRLAGEGFKLRVSQNDFVRRHDGYAETFVLDTPTSRYEFVPWVELRIDRVEDLYHPAAGTDPKYRKNSSTISSPIVDLLTSGKWDGKIAIPSKRAIATATEKLVEVFERVALLYFRAGRPFAHLTRW